MNSKSAISARSRLRIDLLGLLAWMLYAAIGLAMGTSRRFSTDPDYSALGADPPPSVNWFNALLGAASAAVVWGLIQQVRTISRHANAATDEFAPRRTAARLEAALRLLLASVIAGCMAVQLLTMRRFFALPEGAFYYFGDVVTQYLWWFGIFVALTDALMRAKPNSTKRRRLVIDGVLWFCMLAVAAYVVIDLSFIPYLTYSTTRSIDASHEPSISRYPIMTARDEWLLFGTGLLAATAIVGIAAFNFRAMKARGPVGVCRPRWMAITIVILTAAGGYAYWFHALARNYYAPDFEGAGFGAGWWHHAGGVTLAAAWVTYLIYRGWHATRERSTLTAPPRASIDLPLAAEDLVVLTLISVVAILHIGQEAWHYYGNGLTQNVWEGVAWVLFQPSTYFMAALLVRSLQLIRLRWQDGAPAPLILVPITLREIVASWLLLAAILAVAIPTFAAFSFSYWLGPWYRW